MIRTIRHLLLGAALLVCLGVSAAEAATILRQSTAIEVRVGPFVDVADPAVPETGCDLSVADQAELLKANGAATVDISAGTMTAITGANGWCDLSLTTAHTDTVGELVVVVQDSSIYLPVFVRFQVVAGAVYDNVWAAGAAGPLTSEQVNAEVADVVRVDTVTLPGQEAPSSTPTLEEAIAWLYKTFRNKKEQTTNEWRLYNDAGTTVDSKAVVGDAGGATTKEEIVTGP